MIAHTLDLEILTSPELLAVTSSQILVGLGSLYFALIACWAVYWIFFGMSEKKRHASMALLTNQVKSQQKRIDNIEREFSLTIDAFSVSHAKVQTLQLEMAMFGERFEQLESAQFELEQQAQDWAAKTEPTAQEPAEQQPVVTKDTSDYQQVAPVATSSIDQVLPSISLFTPAAGTSQKMDPTLGLIYTSPPENADDLTEIWGIGAVNQQRLNEHGVYFFSQIANWTLPQMEAFNSILGFKGRIEREQWVEQARSRSDQCPSTRAA